MSGLGTKAALSHKVDYNKTYRKGKGAQVRAANCAAPPCAQPRRTRRSPAHTRAAPRRAPAQVDETLFKSSRSSRGGGAGSTAVLSTKEMASVASLLGPVENTSLLSVADYKRVTGRDVVELEEMRQAEAAARHEELARAEARKVRMAEIEAEAKQHVAPTEIEAEHMAEAAAILSNAEMKLAEELDDVKKMNQMMAYAKVVTIRDAQINEKKVMEKERMQEERRLDEIMEIERLKAVKMYDEREQKRMRDAVEGRQVITEQIREREAERVRQLERQDQASAAAAARRKHPLPLTLLPQPSPPPCRSARRCCGGSRRCAPRGREAHAQDAAGAKLSEEVALERSADRTEDAGDAQFWRNSGAIIPQICAIILTPRPPSTRRGSTTSRRRTRGSRRTTARRTGASRRTTTSRRRSSR